MTKRLKNWQKLSQKPLKMNCEVRDNCLRRYDCDWCRDYDEYVPVDRSIKSPRQLAKKEEKKKERKVKKLSNASKRGKANRRNGRKAERDVENLLKDMGLDAQRTPMSGALKAAHLIPQLKDHVSGDIRIQFKGKELIVECKRNIRSDRWYNLLDTGIVHIKGFCYGLRKDLFEYLVNGLLDGEVHDIPDSRFKLLHKYFDQDNSDMVVVTRPYHEPLFFLKEDTYKLFGGK